jgi:ADP-heptose:LPS heptosyltransferase
VISRPLEGLGATRAGVILASSADDFIAAAERAIAAPDHGRAERLALAAANTWDARVDALEDHLRQASGAARARARRPLLRPAAHRPSEWSRRRGRVLSWRSRLLFAAIEKAGWLYYAGRVGLRTMRGQRHPLVRRILVVRANAYLGDVLVLLPTLARLRRRFPEARIVLGVFPGPPPPELLQLVDDVVVLSDVFAPSARLSAARVARQFAAGYDVVISGSGYFLHRETLWCGAPYRIGLDENELLEALNTHAVPFDGTRHEAENNLALAEALCGSDPDGRVPELTLEPEALERAFNAVRDRLRLDTGRIVTIHPGAKRLTRRWPADRFAALSAKLLEESRDVQVVFSGIGGDGALVEQIRGLIPEHLRSRAFSAAGETDLLGLVALLDHSAAVVSNDTGTMHVARTRGAPLVALLGPENDRLWGPHPEGRGPAIALRHEVPCAPCRLFSCDLMACMKLLTVDEVHAAVRDLLGGGASGATLGSALVRRQRRHEWRSAAHGGYMPPLTTVVSCLEPDGSRVRVDAQLHEAYRSVAAQTYPALEWLIVAELGMLLPPIPDAPGVSVRVLRTAGNEGNGWRQAAVQAAGTFVATTQPGVLWRRERISEDVAILLRKPHLAGCEHASGREFAVLPADPKRVTVRREALLARAELAEAISDQLSAGSAIRATG